MRDLVHKLAELGWLFLRIRKYVDARSQDKALGIVGQVRYILGAANQIVLCFNKKKIPQNAAVRES